MINVDYLLDYYEKHPDYEVKNIKNNKINIEYIRSKNNRKNVIAELYIPTGRFYLNKNKSWVNINHLNEVRTTDDVIQWIEKDSNLLR